MYWKDRGSCFNVKQFSQDLCIVYINHIFIFDKLQIKGKLRVFAVTFYTIDLTIKAFLLIPAEIENQYGLD